MTDKEKRINRELTSLLQEVQQMRVDFNLCLTTLQIQKSDVVNHINKIKYLVKYES